MSVAEGMVKRIEMSFSDPQEHEVVSKHSGLNNVGQRDETKPGSHHESNNHHGKRAALWDG
jgi:hypothetical protein